MKPFIKIECENCGPFAIANPELISIFTLDLQGEGRQFTIAANCNYCNLPIVEDCTEDFALRMCEYGVNLFSWYTGDLLEVKVS